MYPSQLPREPYGWLAEQSQSTCKFITIGRDTGQDTGVTAGRDAAGPSQAGPCLQEACYRAAAATAVRITDTMPSQFPFTQWS